MPRIPQERWREREIFTWRFRKGTIQEEGGGGVRGCLFIKENKILSSLHISTSTPLEAISHTTPFFFYGLTLYVAFWDGFPSFSIFWNISHIIARKIIPFMFKLLNHILLYIQITFYDLPTPKKRSKKENCVQDLSKSLVKAKNLCSHI